jgi:hypothetical protein
VLQGSRPQFLACGNSTAGLGCLAHFEGSVLQGSRPQFLACGNSTAGLGFEPRHAAPKTAVLPLDDPANQWA